MEKKFFDAKKVIDRIVFSYLDKVEIMHNILEHSRKARTIREIATIVYGMPHPPKDTAEFIKLKMIMSKCFSCLEYLRMKILRSVRKKTGPFTGGHKFLSNTMSVKKYLQFHKKEYSYLK